MPLRVQCPGGCEIRMPANRAGRIVRCPECKAVIRLGKPTEASGDRNESGEPVSMRAELVQPPEIRTAGDTEAIASFPPLDQPNDLPAGEQLRATTQDSPSANRPATELDALDRAFESVADAGNSGIENPLDAKKDPPRKKKRQPTKKRTATGANETAGSKPAARKKRKKKTPAKLPVKPSASAKPSASIDAKTEAKADSSGTTIAPGKRPAVNPSTAKPAIAKPAAAKPAAAKPAAAKHKAEKRKAEKRKAEKPSTTKDVGPAANPAAAAKGNTPTTAIPDVKSRAAEKPVAGKKPAATKPAATKPGAEKKRATKKSDVPQPRRLPVPAPGKPDLPVTEPTRATDSTTAAQQPPRTKKPRRTEKPNHATPSGTRSAATRPTGAPVPPPVPDSLTTPVPPPVPDAPGSAFSIATGNDSIPERVSINIRADAVAEDPVDTRTPEAIRARVQRARRDRVLISRFVAICIFALGLINLIPAIYHWSAWSAAGTDSSLPRWIYLQVFLAALHVVYSVFLIQVADWSALRAVSVAMLVFAALFGAVTTGLLLGGAHSPITRALELATSLRSSAVIWSVIMLILTTMVSYLGGREATNWKRTDQLLLTLEP